MFTLEDALVRAHEIADREQAKQRVDEDTRTSIDARYVICPGRVSPVTPWKPVQVVLPRTK